MGVGAGRGPTRQTPGARAKVETKVRRPAPRTEPSERYPVAPLPPRQRRAFSTVGGAVETGGDPADAAVLGKLWKVDPGLARALTHGFHSYAGRMHPSIARGAIAAWSQPGDVVVDPFCGSGTVLVEAMGAGRVAIGVDASPLGVAIAQTRTTLLDEAARAELVAEANRIAEESGDNARKRRRPEIPAWGDAEFTRFFPHVAFELFGLRALVMEARPRKAVAHALRMCFSSNLVKLMKAGPEAPRDGGDKRIARGVPSRLLSDRAAELASSLAVLARRTPPGTPAPAIHLGDARDLKFIKSGSVQLIVSSPPYAGTYDYAAQHDVRFAWMEFPRRAFERTQLGARAGANTGRGGFGADPADWNQAQDQWMAEMARILTPGGRAMLVVGDGVVGERPEDASDAIANAADRAGLLPVARASQERATHDRRLRDIFAGRPRREHLLLLRKPSRAR
jgi:SAM-dependent methyltransferase